MNARGKKRTNKTHFKHGILWLFTTPWCVKGTLCFVLRAGRWLEGILGPHWLAARRCSCAPAAPRALLIWRVNVEGATERGPGVSEKTGSLFQEESGVCWLPSWENLLRMIGDNMQDSLLLQWFKGEGGEKKKKEKTRRESERENEREKGLTFSARLGRCILLLLLFLLLLPPLPPLPSG